MSDQAIAEGRPAWERIKGNAKTTFSDWAFDRRLPAHPPSADDGGSQVQFSVRPEVSGRDYD